MMDGIGIMIRSIKMEKAHEVSTNVRVSMHVPPGITSPLGPTLSMAGRDQAYDAGVHWKRLAIVAPME